MIPLAASQGRLRLEVGERSRLGGWWRWSVVGGGQGVCMFACGRVNCTVIAQHEKCHNSAFVKIVSQTQCKFRDGGQKKPTTDADTPPHVGFRGPLPE